MENKEIYELFFEVLDELRKSDEVIHDNMGGGDDSYIYDRIHQYKCRFLKAFYD